MISTIGVIGNGHYGQFVIELAKQHFPDLKVKVFSRRAKIDNEEFFDFQTASACDIVVLCGSIGDYDKQLQEVVKFISPDTIVVDVSIVKNYANELRERYLEGVKFISLHTLFGPQSYKKFNKSSNKLKVVVTDYTLKNNDYLLLRDIFNNIGFEIIEMSADEHDKFVAETLFVTHYISKIILEAGFHRTEIDTLSFRYLMDGVESVKDDEKLFKEIYRLNPHCKTVVERLYKAEAQVWKSQYRK